MKKMKTRIGLWISASMLALSLVLLLTNCTKDDDFTIPLVETNEVTEITPTTATSGGTISSDGGATVTERGVCWSENQNPTIADNKTTDGSGAGSFTSAISGLTANTTYYVRAYASNSKGTGYGSEISFKTLEDKYGTMTDIEGNNYNTVKIGTQVWTVENLLTTKYNDGTPIPNVTDDDEWSDLTTGAYCNYDNLESNAEIYGRLYNWNAVNTGKLAPAGWHVPTDDDWTILENYLIANGYNYDGTLDEDKIAKALCAKTNWELSVEAGTPGAAPENNNSTGFAALPGGYRSGSNGAFNNVGENGSWWSATERSASNAYYRALGYNYGGLYRGGYYKGNGFSVRLVRD